MLFVQAALGSSSRYAHLDVYILFNYACLVLLERRKCLLYALAGNDHHL